MDLTNLEIILICTNSIFLIFLAISIFFNVKHGILIIKFTEAIENALDVLDERYDSISQVLEIPLFFDSPQIRAVVEDVRHCRDSLLESANILSNISQEEDEEKTDN